VVVDHRDPARHVDGAGQSIIGRAAHRRLIDRLTLRRAPQRGLEPSTAPLRPRRSNRPNRQPTIDIRGSPVRGLRRASAAAGLSCLGRGAQAAMPDQGAIDRAEAPLPQV
jgi:hypothetical protein